MCVCVCLTNCWLVDHEDRDLVMKSSQRSHTVILQPWVATGVFKQWSVEVRFEFLQHPTSDHVGNGTEGQAGECYSSEQREREKIRSGSERNKDAKDDSWSVKQVKMFSKQLGT